MFPRRRVGSPEQAPPSHRHLRRPLPIRHGGHSLLLKKLKTDESDRIDNPDTSDIRGGLQVKPAAC